MSDTVKRSPTKRNAARRDRSSSTTPDAGVGAQGTAAVAAAGTANVEPVMDPTEKSQLVHTLEQGIRGVAEEFPSPEALDLFMECTEIRRRLKKQETPAHRVEALQASVDSVKEAAEIEDGSRGYVDALKLVIAQSLAAIDEAKAIEAARPDEFAQVGAGDDFSQVRPRKAARR